MITLTREQALELLKTFSMIDGYLMSIRDSNHVAEQLQEPSMMLSKLLSEGK